MDEEKIDFFRRKTEDIVVNHVISSKIQSNNNHERLSRLMDCNNAINEAKDINCVNLGCCPLDIVANVIRKLLS